MNTDLEFVFVSKKAHNVNGIIFIAIILENELQQEVQFFKASLN